MKASFALLCCLLAPIAMLAQEEVERTPETMIAGVRANLAAYEKIKLSGASSSASFKIKLGETTSSYKGGLVFDGFRITAPEDLEGRDFVWYFNAPGAWSTWYVVPVSGDVEDAFRNWLNADKIYQGLDVAGEKDRFRALQTLDGSYFKPGRDYIFWFQQNKETKDTELRVTLGFAAKPADDKEWGHAGVEKALKLKPAGAAQQVKELGSRGGRILLDQAFFSKGYAEGRIDDVFFNKRQTSWTRGGYFVTIEMSCPPCRTEPSLAKIRAKYGDADFVQSAEEHDKVYGSREGKGKPDKEDRVVTHFYDYFGFEIDPNDPAETVLRVRTQANDFSKLQPPDADGHFAQIGMKNLTVFYKDKKEVGRMYFFTEGGKVPLLIQEPPVGQYRNEDEVLDYQGGGRWLLLDMEDHQVVRRIPFANHRMEGLAEGFYSDGSPSFKASYKAGELHGEAVQYSEEGKVVKRQRFRDGEPVDESEGAPKKGPSKTAEPKVKPKAL
ncbi:hypothetical protein [Prosthecobacter sp.]|uniref:toxin-antitoxin system YwqK family antitoxin n=1 Tax=Prosthecobacter sp. TaxID=1965333 RepID=UPI001D3CC5A1|nr:hypothetical protein [Prosthecobacter sp.]MCB1278292.1 hypothetical protein [Prosthecobacter sp.]